MINILYDGKPLDVKFPALQAPFGVDSPNDGRPRKYADSSNKTTVQLAVPPTDETKALRDFFAVIETALKAHLKENADLIATDKDALALKGDKATKMIRSLQEEMYTYHAIVRQGSNEAYAPNLKLTVPTDLKGIPRESVLLKSKKGYDISLEEVTRRSTVRANAKVKGVFVSEAMVTVQMELTALMLIESGGKPDAGNAFEGEIENVIASPAPSRKSDDDNF